MIIPLVYIEIIWNHRSLDPVHIQFLASFLLGTKFNNKLNDCNGWVVPSSFFHNPCSHPAVMGETKKWLSFRHLDLSLLWIGSSLEKLTDLTSHKHHQRYASRWCQENWLTNRSICPGFPLFLAIGQKLAAAPSLPLAKLIKTKKYIYIYYK